MSDKNLQKYYLRLATEGLLKAFLWGAAIGFSALTILGGLYWMMAWQSVWVCLVVWGAVSASATLVLYYWKYKPTTKYIAHRVDDLGLHERILTMTELEGDESYIAQRQRRDAVEALQLIGPELLKIGVSLRTVITFTASAVLGIGLVIVAFLGAMGIIPSGKDLFFSKGNGGALNKYTITYVVKDGCLGKIQGQAEQEVEEGKTTQGVVAIAGEGWAFLRWTDGVENPYREDVATEDKTYIAVFIEVTPGVVGSLNDNAPNDAPGDTSSNNGQPNKDSEQGNEAKGKYEEINQIVNGQTYYGDLYGEAYEEVMDELAGEAYDEDEKDIIGGYFDNIEKDKTEEEENN